MAETAASGRLRAARYSLRFGAAVWSAAEAPARETLAATPLTKGQSGAKALWDSLGKGHKEGGGPTRGRRWGPTA